jgi:opacity protein-like surface antigen
MYRPVAAAILAIAAASAAAQAQTAPALAGLWSQASSGKELVLQPKIKLQPNMSSTYGTSLGGSVGYGSMTKTTIVTEAVPLDVQRRMKLDLAADGSFTWVIETRQPEGKGCTKTVRQLKRGRASTKGDAITFAVAGGTEAFEKSCGGSGSADLPASRETYTATVSGNRLELSGSSRRWLFTRG